MTEYFFDEVKYYPRGLKYLESRWTYGEDRSEDKFSREK